MKILKIGLVFVFLANIITCSFSTVVISGNTNTSGMTQSKNSALLDGIQGLGVVYSTNKLVSSYTGSCMRIRRVSDNQEIDIPFDANGKADVATFNTFTAATTATIVIFYDQSGYSDDVTQSSTTSQPNVSVVNGEIVPVFTSDFMTKTTSHLQPVLTNDTTIFNVINIQSYPSANPATFCVGSDAYIGDGGVSSYYSNYYGTNDDKFLLFSVGDVYTTNYNLTSNFYTGYVGSNVLVTHKRNKEVVSSSRNGILLQSLSGSIKNIEYKTSTVFLGGNVVGNICNHKYFATIVFTRCLTPTEESAVTKGLKTMYGIQ